MAESALTFGAYAGGADGSRQWTASLLTSAAIYAGLALAALSLGSATTQIIKKQTIDVTFVEKVIQTPPPAPAPVAAPAQAPAAAAPVVRPNQKIRKLEQPPPPKEMVAPKTMPTDAPREADPSEDKGIAVHGEPGTGDAAGLEGGAQGGVVGGQVGGAMALPEDATPPLPASSNPVPLYPQEARAAGRTGTVVLKVVILADGTVADTQVMRGDEPFVSAALSAVRTWRYTPARYKGHAITVYRIIQIPFKLTA